MPPRVQFVGGTTGQRSREDVGTADSTSPNSVVQKLPGREQIRGARRELHSASSALDKDELSLQNLNTEAVLDCVYQLNQTWPWIGD